jgi:hypothetical protein
MKVELSPRDIELILFLLGNTLANDFDSGKPLIYSIEDIALIEKLEKALLKHKQEPKDPVNLNPSNLSH